MQMLCKLCSCPLFKDAYVLVFLGVLNWFFYSWKLKKNLMTKGKGLSAVSRTLLSTAVA